MSETASNTPPTSDPVARPGVRKALLIFLGILFLLPGACGGLFFGTSVAEWIDGGFALKGETGGYMAMFLFFATPSVLASIALLGLLMRISKRSWTPKVSLALAILATITVALSYLMLRSAFAQEGASTDLVLSGLAAVALALAALPQYMHWRKSRVGEPQ